jgi:hypothetical protein
MSGHGDGAHGGAGGAADLQGQGGEEELVAKGAAQGLQVRNL